MAACVGERGRGVVMADCGLAFSFSLSPLPAAVYGDFVKPSDMPPCQKLAEKVSYLAFHFWTSSYLGTELCN